MKKRILVHVCCAPCFSVLFDNLKKEFEDIFLLWYNPNIHPFTEYKNRWESVEKFAQDYSLKLISIHEYNIEKFIRSVVYREKARCVYCYHNRLEFCASMAKKSGFTHFTSSLLASPYQNHELLIQMGRDLEKRHKVEFYYWDFRSDWKIRESAIEKCGLYRQQYCGCIYSEEERYASEIRKLKGKGKK
jgi:predicted adenine nucleotide alpha hydrolase (AANH) superfamily ATPase